MTDAGVPGAATASARVIRRAALIAGATYVLMFLLAIGANFAVMERLVVEDSATTLANLSDQAGSVRLAIAAFGAIAVLDIVIAWGLHVLLRGVSEHRSLLAAWLRVAYSAILAVAVGFLALALEIAATPERFAGWDLSEREAMAALALLGFDTIWLIGLAVFGLHLVVVGAVLVQTRLAPRALGFLLAAAGAAYIVDTLAHIVLSDYGTVEGVMLPIVAVLSMVAELWLAGWLLARGARADRALPGPKEPAHAAA